MLSHYLGLVPARPGCTPVEAERSEGEWRCLASKSLAVGSHHFLAQPGKRVFLRLEQSLHLVFGEESELVLRAILLIQPTLFVQALLIEQGPAFVTRQSECTRVAVPRTRFDIEGST